MMDKLVLSDSYDWGGSDRNALELVKVSSRGPERGQFTKSAAMFDDKIASIRHEPGTSVLHAIAMGASERYGPNKNADAFSRAMLKSAHHTFVTHGHVFKEHINDDPKKASGSILHSVYNDAMDRVELILRVKNAAWERELEKVANDEDIAFSMSCRVPYDVCSYCGNKAPTRASYCEHMRKYAGQMLDDGHLVHVDNPKGIFFDMSGVGRQADRIAYGLRQIKTASLGRVVTGAELFEMWRGAVPVIGAKSATLRRKADVLRKLAAIEKEIELTIGGLDDLLPAFGCGDCEDESIGKLRAYTGGNDDGRLGEVLNALGDAQILLPVKEFARLCLPSELCEKSAVAGAEQLLPGLFSRMLDSVDDVCGDSRYDIKSAGSRPASPWVASVVRGMVPNLSLEHKAAKARIVRGLAAGVKRGSFSVKSASFPGPESAGIAREYAKYKLAFVDSMAGERPSLARLSVLQNFFAR
jgi:hypothetical protein